MLLPSFLSPVALGVLACSTRRHSSCLYSSSASVDEKLNTQLPLVHYFNTTLQFPPYPELIALKQGESVVSETVTVPLNDGRSYDFCVKLYPRGGGHSWSHSVVREKDRSSRLPFVRVSQAERVGAYLQFLPQNKDDSVDVTFALRMKGRQKKKFPRFDVEWRSGMRFVDLSETKLAQGRANDFGAHLMQTHLLADFVGYDETDPAATIEPLDMQLEVMIHDKLLFVAQNDVMNADPSFNSSRAPQKSFVGSMLQDLREHSDDSSGFHNPEQLRVGRIIVPILRTLSQRPGMFQRGTYPGVEYRILRIIDPESGADLFYSKAGVDYEVKPIYSLVPQLERQWPVRVNEKDIPKLYSPSVYNAISAVGSLFTAMTGLIAAFLISQAISVFVIPSRSMEPNLQVGDVLLVDKITPRLSTSLHLNNYNAWIGEVVLFRPTKKLQDLVYQSSGKKLTSRELFVKRIASGPGSSLKVTDASGSIELDGQPPNEQRTLCGDEPSRLIEKYLRPGDEYTVGPNQVAVLGDCKSVSIDSRVWGPLPVENIIGRPLLRIWPLSRIGGIQSLSSTIDTDWSD